MPPAPTSPAPRTEIAAPVSSRDLPDLVAVTIMVPSCCALSASCAEAADATASEAMAVADSRCLIFEFIVPLPELPGA
ncbi:hypothetical protein [Sphingopyxis fribergensis]